jgi:hypothetical protein
MDDGSRLLKAMLSGHLKTKEDANGFMESIFTSLKEDSPFKEFWIGVATRLHSLAIEKLEKEAVQIEAYLDEGKSFDDVIKLDESFDESKHFLFWLKVKTTFRAMTWCQPDQPVVAPTSYLKISV